MISKKLMTVTIGLALALCTQIDAAGANKDKEKKGKRRSYPIDIITQTFGYNEKTPRSIELDDLFQGCSKRDCIKSIDKPRFVPAKDASFLPDDAWVLALNFQGIRKAYPKAILNAHEIVNDNFGNTPVAITFCPLCGSGVAFIRRLNGKTVEFGVSGLLYNSDLVMHDRSSFSLWEQITGQAMVGPETGSRLQKVPVTITQWKNWHAQHPDTQVLLPHRGEWKSYASTHYAAYETSDGLVFPISDRDARLHVKKVVYGVEIDGIAIAYEAKYLQKNKVLQDQVAGRKLQVSYHKDGSVVVTDITSKQQFTAIRLFWFAWYTFHPKTYLRTEV